MSGVACKDSTHETYVSSPLRKSLREQQLVIMMHKSAATKQASTALVYSEHHHLR